MPAAPTASRSLFRAAVAALAFAFLPGCAGQLKLAILDHAKSTRSVADTINKALASIQCEGSKDTAACQAAVGTIADQARALNQGAAELERSGK